MKSSAPSPQTSHLWNHCWLLTPAHKTSGGGESMPRAVGQPGPLQAPKRRGTMEMSTPGKEQGISLTQNTEEFSKPWLEQVSNWLPGTANYHQEFLLNTNTPLLTLRKILFHKKSEGSLWEDGDAWGREVKYFPSGTSWHPAFSSETHQEEPNHHSKIHLRREWLA